MEVQLIIHYMLLQSKKKKKPTIMNLPDFWIQVASSSCDPLNLGLKPVDLNYYN